MKVKRVSSRGASRKFGAQQGHKMLRYKNRMSNCVEHLDKKIKSFRGPRDKASKKTILLVSLIY